MVRIISYAMLAKLLSYFKCVKHVSYMLQTQSIIYLFIGDRHCRMPLTSDFLDVMSSYVNISINIIMFYNVPY